MQTRFSGLINMDIPTWVSTFFKVKVDNIGILLQEHLIELQNDEMLRA